jgi:hypothetical protein
MQTLDLTVQPLDVALNAVLHDSRCQHQHRKTCELWRECKRTECREVACCNRTGNEMSEHLFLQCGKCGRSVPAFMDACEFCTVTKTRTIEKRAAQAEEQEHVFDYLQRLRKQCRSERSRVCGSNSLRERS